jgi:hypothetical protein
VAEGHIKCPPEAAGGHVTVPSPITSRALTFGVYRHLEKLMRFCVISRGCLQLSILEDYFRLISSTVIVESITVGPCQSWYKQSSSWSPPMPCRALCGGSAFRQIRVSFCQRFRSCSAVETALSTLRRHEAAEVDGWYPRCVWCVVCMVMYMYVMCVFRMSPPPPCL